MNAEELKKVITDKYGYTSYSESGVVMFTGDQPVDKMRKEISTMVKAVEYNGSWGVKGYPGGRKSAGAPAKAKPEEIVSDSEEETDMPDSSDAEISMASDSFEQMSLF